MGHVLDFLQLTSFQPGDLLVVLSLVLLEGLLSCDNAVALAMLVRPLPREQQGRALRYGIIGAYLFLFAALLAATWIVRQWYLKLIGGCYLLWLAISHFRQRSAHGDDDARPAAPRLIPGLSVFWSTVVTVELTDMVFSVDSIAAAVALSDKLWVLLLGSMLSILMMRFAAQGVVKLLRRFPGLETAAFAAVAVIGFELLLGFPLDVIGRAQRFPPGTAYATAAEYAAATGRQHQPVIAIAHVVTINSTAAPEPQADHFADPLQYREAHGRWLLRGRQFVHLDNAAAALVILGLFGLGFLRRARSAA